MKALNTKIEKVINGYLGNDPEIAARLRTHHGKSIGILLRDLSLKFTILIDQERIHLVDDSPSTVQISGSSLSLLRLALTEEPVPSFLQQHSIILEGNILFLQDVKQVFKSIQVDWEDYLAPWLGPTIATHTARAGRHLLAAVKQKLKRSRYYFAEYIHEELRYFPPQEEVRDWVQDIADLRADVERAEARIDRIIASL